MTLSDDALKTARHEVDRLMGRCILRFQIYELGVKALLAGHRMAFDMSGKPRFAFDPSQKTLGVLVGEMMGSVLVTEGQQGQAASPDPGFSFLVQLALPEDDFARTKADLRDLVALRNGLVHQFVLQNDLGTAEGCLAAQATLRMALDRLDKAYGDLRQWAVELQDARSHLAAKLKSPAIRAVFEDGSIP